MHRYIDTYGFQHCQTVIKPLSNRYQTVIKPLSNRYQIVIAITVSPSSFRRRPSSMSPLVPPCPPPPPFSLTHAHAHAHAHAYECSAVNKPTHVNICMRTCKRTAPPPHSTTWATAASRGRSAPAPAPSNRARNRTRARPHARTHESGIVVTGVLEIRNPRRCRKGCLNSRTRARERDRRRRRSPRLSISRRHRDGARIPSHKGTSAQAHARTRTTTLRYKRARSPPLRATKGPPAPPARRSAISSPRR